MSEFKGRPQAQHIDDLKNIENTQISDLYQRQRVLEHIFTGATYVDSGIFDKRGMKAAVITIKEEGGAQSIYHKVLACIDPDDWYEVQGETSLAAGQHVAYEISDPWAFLKLQVKNNSGSGKVAAYIGSQTP